MHTNTSLRYSRASDPPLTTRCQLASDFNTTRIFAKLFVLCLNQCTGYYRNCSANFFPYDTLFFFSRKSTLNICQVHVQTASNGTVYFLEDEAANGKILFHIFYLFMNIRFSPINYFFLPRLELVKFKYLIFKTGKYSNSIFSKTKPKKFTFSSRFIFDVAIEYSKIQNSFFNIQLVCHNFTSQDLFRL